jgi:hypothetical protein
MNGDVAESEALREIEEQMRSMINGDCPPYDAAWIIWGKAASVLTSPELLHPLWLIWGALTDWVENRPNERSEAESEMLRAAREWLALKRDDAMSRKAYLDRWVYKEMGYGRTEESARRPDIPANRPSSPEQGDAPEPRSGRS